ncbi:MAG: ribulose-phosphate 3-epimerase [Clostridia bacterium]|nr:ribulose-phosphate 3-epimerase [Clostridia bacterium]
MIKVLPSSNPEKEDNLLQYAKSLEDLGVEYLHCDVMDGKFVEAKCLSYETLKLVRDNCNILLDIHLMVEDVFENVKKFASLKPSIITIHLEALKSFGQFKKIAKFLKERDILVGLSIKPNTNVHNVFKYLNYIDLILIMSVEPGKSGQKFIDGSLERIKDIATLCAGKDILIEVDGGVNLENAHSIIDSGAKFLVMGSAFYNEKNKKKLLNSIDKHYKI